MVSALDCYSGVLPFKFGILLLLKHTSGEKCCASLVYFVVGTKFLFNAFNYPFSGISSYILIVILRLFPEITYFSFSLQLLTFRENNGSK